ncbi:hypothetical protein [Riemerella columbina]|uniref:hypothetical protein n=1 Tax=Riemerella columbina TaxID=103810 RepID=UPI00266FC6DE|nr:hypothetical protein [Riemerella columbina]WKS95133.1 hypothetical protein NYR17_09495 [Riemerella columbina]
MVKTLSFLLLFLSIMGFAQQILSGYITDESGFALSEVWVVNLSNDEKTKTNAQGFFQIKAQTGERLRWVKNGFERSEHQLNAQDFSSIFKWKLRIEVREIPEVKISIKATGDLKNDVRQFPAQKALKNLKRDIYLDYQTKTSADLQEFSLQNAERFIQPKGDGFSVGKVQNQWQEIDLMIHLVEHLGDHYFEALGISKMDKTALLPLFFKILIRLRY